MEMQKQSVGYTASKISSFGESWRLFIIFSILFQNVQICETVSFALIYTEFWLGSRSGQQWCAKHIGGHEGGELFFLNSQLG